MAIGSAATLVDALRRHGLVEPGQLDALAELQARFPEPRALAGELIRLGHLTPFQVNCLFQDRGQELVLGSYILLERLGEGGMGQVYKARHPLMNRVVALKVIRKDRLGHPEVVQRFLREIQAVGQLAHPNIVIAHDAQQIGGTLLLVMEYVEGTDLSRLVKESGPLPVGMACEYLRQAALGLQHAHERGMVHRDIKPSNLMLARGGRGLGTIKLLDLGLARLNQAPDEPEATAGTNALVDTSDALTQEGAVVGTLDYLSPEQATNSRTVDIRADLYSLGCTFYFLLTGKAPFAGGTASEKLLKHRLDDPAPIETLRPEVTPSVATIVRKLMAKKPQDRYQTPAELAAALSVASDDTQNAPMAIPLGPAAGVTAPLALPVPPRHKRKPMDWRALLTRQGWRELARDRKRLAIAGAVLVAATLLIVLLALLLWPASRAGGPFEGLDSAKITVEDRAVAGSIDGLVAVIGDQRLRHWGSANAVTISPDRRLLASTGSDGAVRIWDFGSGRQQRALARGNEFSRMQFVQGGKQLAGGDRALKLWDTATGQQVSTPISGRFLALSPDAQLAATLHGPQEEQVKLWNLATGKERSSFVGHTASVHCIAFSADNQTAATGGEDLVVHVWDTTSGRPRHSLRGHAANVNSVRLSADGKLLAAAERGGVVKLWDVSGSRELASFTASSPWSLSPDGKILAVRGSDGSIRLWDTAAGRDRVALRPDGAVGVLAFSPDSQLLAANAAQSIESLRLWDVSAGTARPAGSFRAGPIAALAFTPDRRTLASASSDGQVRLWDTASGAERQPGAAGADWYTSTLFSHDGRTLALISRNWTVKLWDTATGKERAALKGHPREISAIAFSDDDRLLATGSADGTIKLWNVSNGQPLTSIKHGVYGISTLAFSPEGKTVISCEWYGIKQWDVANGLALSTLDATRQGVSTFALAPNARTVVAGNHDGTVQVRDLASGKVQNTLQGLRGSVRVALSAGGRMLAARGSSRGEDALKVWDLLANQERATLSTSPNWALAPDGRTLASGFSNGRLQVWDTTTGQVRTSLEGHTREVAFVSYSPDSRLLASAGGDGRVIVWDPAARKKDLRVWQLPGPVQRATFAPDGRHLATVNANGSVYILRLERPGSQAGR